jgi:hypothetical protein
VTQFLPRKLTFYGMVLKSIACVALVHKAADKIRITIFFKSSRIKKINELVITSYKLTNNFTGLVTNGLRLDVVCGLPVGPCFRRLWLYIALTDQFVIQSQGPLNLCCSVNIQFPIDN